MKYPEKLSTILLFIDEARAITPHGKPCRINAVATIYPVINSYDTAYIFEKLEKDEKVIKIVSAPPVTDIDRAYRLDEPEIDCYVFHALPEFDAYFDAINNSQTRPVELMTRPKFEAKESKIVFNGNHWLEPARQFILAAQQAKIIALQENPVAGRDFLKRIGSNHVLRSQAICFEPKKSWKILADLPAEGRSPEAVNSYHPIWLRDLDSNQDSRLQRPVSCH